MDKMKAMREIIECARRDWRSTKNDVYQGKHWECAHDVLMTWADQDDRVAVAVKVLGINLAACHYAIAYDAAMEHDAKLAKVTYLERT